VNSEKQVPLADSSGLSAEFWQLAKLSVPLVLAQLAQNATSLVDTLMVGKLGQGSLAGIAIGSTVFMFVSIVASGCVLGVSAVVAQAVGAGDKQTCGRAIRQGLWLSVGLFIPAFVLFWNIHPILLWLNQPPEAAAASSAYLRAVSWGLLPSLGCFAFRGLLEGHTNTRPIMFIAAIGVVLNIILNDILMFGRFGLPRLGLVGTGYASSIVLSSMFAMFFLYSTRCYRELEIVRALRYPDWKMLAELIRVGGPIGMALACESAMFAASGIAMGTLGATELAAHQIALQTASFSFMVPLGISIAASARIGQFVGASNGMAARRAGIVGALTCGGVMMLFAGFFLACHRQIVGCFLDATDPSSLPVVELASTFLMIAAAFQIADGLQVSGSLALRGLKDTLAGLLITVFSYLCVGCVSGWLFCFVFEFGSPGLWWGMTVGLAVAAVLLLARFFWRVQIEIAKNLD
jgi:MATE family multidrug resistance protein